MEYREAKEKVGIANMCRRTLDRIQEVASSLQASISTMITLRGESHGGTVGATSASFLVITILF